MRRVLKNSLNFHELFVDPVSRIWLQKPLDSCLYTEFDDNDLIKSLTEYIQALDVKKIRKPLFPKNKMIFGGRRKLLLGGGRGAKIISGDRVYNFDFREENKLWFNGGFYLIKNDTDCPFDKLYDISVKRHGTKKIDIEDPTSSIKQLTDYINKK